MAQRLPGFPWQGVEYNAPLDNFISNGLAGAIIRATLEASTHPGLYQARYDDAVTPQESIRPALIVPPSELDKWNAVLAASIGQPSGL